MHSVCPVGLCRARPLRQFASLTATSPKGRGLGKEMKFAWIAKGSPFEERLPPVGGRCRVSDRKGNEVDLRSKDGEGEAVFLHIRILFYPKTHNNARGFVIFSG